MIETELRPLSPVVAPVLGSGRGGDGWDDNDNDPGDDWGWSDDHDGDEEAMPYRRSRIVRAVALVTAVAVVTGSIGTWVAILAVGSPPPYAVSAVKAHVPTSEQQHATGLPTTAVSFVVSNDSSRAGRASCRVVVSAGGTTVGAAVVTSASVAPGTSRGMTVRVDLSAGGLAGHGPAGVQVVCVPARTPTA